MSQSKFKIEVTDEVTLTRDSMVVHKEHGPMYVEGITIGPHSKRAQFQAERGSIGLKLTEDEIREQWGDIMAGNPAELFDDDVARFENSGISVEGLDVEVTISTEGDQENAEPAHMHAVDQIVRGLQAIRDETEPAECEGANYGLDWETIHGDGED